MQLGGQMALIVLYYLMKFVAFEIEIYSIFSIGQYLVIYFYN